MRKKRKKNKSKKKSRNQQKVKKSARSFARRFWKSVGFSRIFNKGRVTERPITISVNHSNSCLFLRKEKTVVA